MWKGVEENRMWEGMVYLVASRILTGHRETQEHVVLFYNNRAV